MWLDGFGRTDGHSFIDRILESILYTSCVHKSQQCVLFLPENRSLSANPSHAMYPSSLPASLSHHLSKATAFISITQKTCYDSNGVYFYFYDPST